MATEDFGQVLEVSTTNAGSMVAAAAIVGATTLSLADVTVFDELGGQVYIDGEVYTYTAVAQTGTAGSGTPLPIEVTVGESSWTTNTTPKTVVIPSCVTGDWLAVIAGGDALSGSPVTAATTTTTAGATTAWSELAENLTVGAGQEWYHATAAQVTADGSVTVQVARTQSGAAQWGFLVLRGRNSSGVRLFGQQATPGSVQTITGAPSAGSTVVTGFFDWDVSNAPTAWIPAGQTVIETSENSDYTVAAAYWTDQAIGFRSYGTSNFNSHDLKGVGLELTALTSTVVVPSTITGTMTLLTGLTSAAVADETRVEIWPPAPVRTAMVALDLDEGEAVRVTLPYTFEMPDGARPAGTEETVLIEERNPGELYLKDVIAKGMLLIGAGEDLDNYTAEGNFIQLSSTDAAGGVNYPTPYAGVLEVLSTQPGSLIVQRYTAWRTPADLNYPSAWTRVFGNDSWSAWKPLNPAAPIVFDGIASGAASVTTTDTVIAGLTHTFTPPSLDAIYQVTASVDFSNTAVAAGTCDATLFVDATAQPGDIWFQQLGNTSRASMANQWIVSGLSVASHTLALKVQGSAGITGYTVHSDSKMTIILLSY